MELRFNIQDIRLIESHFKINPDYQFTQKPVPISSSLDLKYEKKNKSVQVEISINSDNKNQPFIFNIVLVGLFNFEALPSEKELERIAHINCAAILFPYARETVADVTRRAGVPVFHMEPINFVHFYSLKEKIEAGKEKGKKKKTKQLKK